MSLILHKESWIIQIEIVFIEFHWTMSRVLRWNKTCDIFRNPDLGANLDSNENATWNF